MQYRRSNLEIHNQRKGIHDGGNKGTRHNSGVKANPLCQNRQGTANHLCQEYRYNQGQTHNNGHRYAYSVKQKQFDEIGKGKGNAAKHRHADFLPDDYHLL